MKEPKRMDGEIRKKLLRAQRNEVSECLIYHRLAQRVKDSENRAVLERIARDEEAHAKILERLTGEKTKPHRLKVWFYTTVSRILGLSFGLRLMEQGEKLAEELYGTLAGEYPEVAELFRDEQRHEMEVLGLIREERIEYAGSVVLGLNDALVELTGALAGLTLAMPDTRVIAAVGLITGVAAALSMTASEFLSSMEEAEGKGEEGSRTPLKSATYTGIAYILTVCALIIPYLLTDSVYLALGIMLATSVLIILAYNFYIATARGVRFLRRFLLMSAVSLGVAAVSFFVGMLVRRIFGVDV